MSYYGGKNANGYAGATAGRWVAAHLPMRGVYAEPCCGMLGVLLQRRPAPLEIANDRDGLVTNWWKCVRDEPAEWERLITNTPISRGEFYEMRGRLRGAKAPFGRADLELALAFQQVVRYSLYHGAHGNRNFAARYQPGIRAARNFPDIARLTERLRGVQLENRRAEEVLRRAAPWEDYAIYFDPPYLGADTEPYKYDIDRDEVAELLRAQRGAVCVSGYGDEWDRLGWGRTEFPVKHVRHTGEVTSRVEVVWHNFRPSARPSLFGPGEGGASP